MKDMHDTLERLIKMSACEVYGISLLGKIREYGRAQNAWGGAMCIWNRLSRKYFEKNLSFDGTGELWAEFYRQPQRLQPYERIILGSTYDRVWIKRENLPRLADALQSFLETIPAGNQTIPEIIAILRGAAGDGDLRGVCFNQNSVVWDTWRVPQSYEDAKVECGEGYTREEYDQDKPSRYFDFDRDTEINGKKIWELFEEIDST